MTKNLLGFTIIEMMIALVIGGLLLGMAIPAFNGFIQQQTMTTRVNDFVLAIQYARSEAAKLGGVVSVQTIDDGDDANEWGPGYCVTIGNPGDCGAALRMFDGMADATLNATDDFHDIPALSFNSRGLLTLDGAGTFELCSTDANEDPGRIISVNRIGRTTSQQLVCNP